MLPLLVPAIAIAAAIEGLDADRLEEAWRRLLKGIASSGDRALLAELRRAAPRYRAELQRLLSAPTGSLWDRFSERSLPGAAARIIETEIRATESIAMARALYQDPDVGVLYATMMDGETLEDRDEAMLELASFFPLPSLDGAGFPVPAWRCEDLVRLTFELAAAVDHLQAWSGADYSAVVEYGPHYPESIGDQEGMPPWLAAAILADRFSDPGAKLRLVPVTREEADAFIQKHHSALGTGVPPRTMYAVGAAWGPRLVAVAAAGHPSAPWKRVDQRNVLELSRVASDGTTPNASSLLTARLLDLAPGSKRGAPDQDWLFVTYSLLGEKGSTYESLRDKGLRPTAVIPPKSMGGVGQRIGRKGGAGGRESTEARASLPDVAKIRWEAGPAAGPARFDLLEAARAGVPLQKLLEMG